MTLTARRTIAGLLAAVAVATAAGCRGEDDATPTPTPTQADTQGQAAAPDAVADAEKAEENAALGTMEAFVTAVEDDDEAVFCGIVTDEFLSTIVEDLTVAQCVSELKGVEFKALRKLQNSTPDSVEVDGDVAAGQLRTTEDTSVGVVLRKPEDRWLVHGLRKP